MLARKFERPRRSDGLDGIVNVRRNSPRRACKRGCFPPCHISHSAPAFVVGGTGLVGRHVVELALADARINAVVAPVRRPLPANPKLLAPIMDFERLPEDADWCRADAVICALGTTMRTAGSQRAFRRVDHDYPLAVARLARRRGTPTFVLNSALGCGPVLALLLQAGQGRAGAGPREG